MKVLSLLVLLTIAAASSATATAEREARALFTQFKHKYSRSYRNADEEDRRFRVFQDTLARIERRNRAERASGHPARHDFAEDFCRLKASCCTAMDCIFIPAYCFAIAWQDAAVHGVTQFADHTREEFRRKLNSGGHHTPLVAVAEEEEAGKPFPVPYVPTPPVNCSKNWAADAPAGAYPVRNQDKCGGCWSYALAETIRGAFIAQGNDDPGMLSAEFLLDCAAPAWTAQNCSCGDWRTTKTCYDGCCGGNPPVAANWIEAVGGLPTAAAYGGRGRYDENVTADIARSAGDPFKKWPCNMSVPKAVKPTGAPQFFTGDGTINMTVALLREIAAAKAKGGRAAEIALLCKDYGVLCPVKGTDPPQFLSPEPVLAAHVCARGPVTIGVAAAWDTYVSGVMTTGACSNETQGHSVVAVGVDAEKQAWIVRNSWGGDFGVAPTPPYAPAARTKGGTGGGYILLAYGEDTCRMAELAFGQPRLERAAGE